MKRGSPDQRAPAAAAAALCIILPAAFLAARGSLRGLRPAAASPRHEAAVAPSPARNQPVMAQRIPELERADRDVLGDSQLAGEAEPSFESVAALLPPMKRPREVVGVKHHPHDIGVAPDASLELSDDVDVAGSPVAFFEVGTPPMRLGTPPGTVTKTLWNGCLPVVVATFRRQDFLFRQTVFGWSEKLSPDAELWAYVSLEVRNLGKSSRAAAIRFRTLPDSKTNPPWDWRLRLAPDVAERICVTVPFDISRQKFRVAAAGEFDNRLKEVVDFWTGDLESGMNLVTPEKRVNEAYKAWKAFASLDVDKLNGILEPRDGAGFYEMIFGYSAALYAHALDLWGRHEEARACLESLLSLQTADGLFYQNFGTPDPGALLFALCAHYELTGDAAWLRALAPRMTKMADWIFRKRREFMTGKGAVRPVTFGLIKFRPYCDHPEPAFDYFGDTYCASGVEKTALALAAVGLNEEAKRIGREAAEYRRDILRSMDSAVLDIRGMRVLPIEPDTHRLLKGSKERGGGYYGLIANCMLESEFLPAADRRAAMVMRFIEGKGGLRLGMSEFDGGIDHAYTYGYWLDSLKLDRVEPVILGFYGSLAYGMSRDTYSGVEVTRLFTGDNEPTLPHLYSCTQQLRLLRMMLVREDGDTLWLAQAAPRSWFGEGRTIEIREAPTSYGPVSLKAESHPERGEILVVLNSPSRQPPRLVFLRLRHASGRPISGVKVNGKTAGTFSGETVRLESPAGEMKIIVSY